MVRVIPSAEISKGWVTITPPSRASTWSKKEKTSDAVDNGPLGKGIATSQEPRRVIADSPPITWNLTKQEIVTILGDTRRIQLVARLRVLGIKIDQGRLSKIETGRRPVSDVEIGAYCKGVKSAGFITLRIGA